MLKKLFTFILILAPWFITYLFPLDYDYYKQINLPWFAPPNLFYIIAWTAIYILVAISVVCLLESYKFKDIPLSYKLALLVNYIFNQSYVLVFFGLKNNFLGFASCVGTLVSLVFLANETYKLKPKCVKYLIPYGLLSIFAVVLSFTIYIINL